jgi:hypothetical protein
VLETRECLSAASHAANHAREGSSSGRRGNLARDFSRMDDAVVTSNCGYGQATVGRR